MHREKLVNHNNVKLIRSWNWQYPRWDCFSVKLRSRVIRGGSGCLIGPRGQGCTSAICELRSRYCLTQRRASGVQGRSKIVFSSTYSKSNRNNDNGGQGCKKEGDALSVIHCPGCEPYVFPRRSASRTIQIIASEMIISDDRASADLAAWKRHTRDRHAVYLHLILDSIKNTYFIIYPKALRNSRLHAYRVARDEIYYKWRILDASIRRHRHRVAPSTAMNVNLVILYIISNLQRTSQCKPLIYVSIC